MKIFLENKENYLFAGYLTGLTHKTLYKTRRHIHFRTSCVLKLQVRRTTAHNPKEAE